jgi:hypothetical protein
MDLSDDALEQISEADRIIVDPPFPVDTAMWSEAGQLDWWVKERRPRLEWFGEFAVLMASSGGSKLVIYVPPRASDRSGRGQTVALTRFSAGTGR